MVGAAVVVAPAGAQAQPGGADSALFEQGQKLYGTNCAVCHQAGGTGAPPVFPALNGNEKLKDLNLIVRPIRLGQGAMPPLARLTEEEIAALATYIRNAWSNKFGPASADQVKTLLAGLGKSKDQNTGQNVSIWSGVYTQEQRKRGETLYSGACAQCHGERLNGAAAPDQPPSPAIARTAFLRKWDGKSVAELATYVREMMPTDAPGTLTEQQAVDVLAHMFAVSEMPAGEKELPTDAKALGAIVIEAQKK
jgi:mono/diheme cytochrome c family protein